LRTGVQPHSWWQPFPTGASRCCLRLLKAPTVGTILAFGVVESGFLAHKCGLVFMGPAARRIRWSRCTGHYRTTQQPDPSPFSNVNRAARVAASKTSSTPSPLRLEHSRYLLAPTSRAATSPSCCVTNRRDFFRISSMATGSSRRSFFSPTRMMGTPAHRRVASSIHCVTCQLVGEHTMPSQRGSSRPCA